MTSRRAKRYLFFRVDLRSFFRFYLELFDRYVGRNVVPFTSLDVLLFGQNFVKFFLFVYFSFSLSFFHFISFSFFNLAKLIGGVCLFKRKGDSASYKQYNYYFSFFSIRQTYTRISRDIEKKRKFKRVIKEKKKNEGIKSSTNDERRLSTSVSFSLYLIESISIEL